MYYLYSKGTDHAGIATQLQVEKALIAEGMFSFLQYIVFFLVNHIFAVD